MHVSNTVKILLLGRFSSTACVDTLHSTYILSCPLHIATEPDVMESVDPSDRAAEHVDRDGGIFRGGGALATAGLLPHPRHYTHIYFDKNETDV